MPIDNTSFLDPTEAISNHAPISLNLDEPESGPCEETEMSEIETLTWAAIDETISESDQEKLKGILSKDRSSIRTYTEIVQFHAMMLDYFGSGIRLEVEKLLFKHASRANSLIPAWIVSTRRDESAAVSTPASQQACALNR